MKGNVKLLQNKIQLFCMSVSDTNVRNTS